MKLTTFRTASEVGSPLYIEKPYVVLSKENVVLFAGSASQIRRLPSYYDDCRVDVRRHDLHLNNNARRISA